MFETIIESVLTGKLDSVLLLNWLNNESIEQVSEDCILLCCNRNEFVTYFLSYLRSQTEGILQTNSTALQVLHQGTPERSSSTHRKHHRSISDPTSETDRKDSLSVKTDRHSSHESPNRERKKPGRKVKTKLFSDDRPKETSSSDESRLSIGVDRLAITSTPMKNGMKFSEYPALPSSSPVTPHSRSFNERCDTPRMSHRHSRSQDKNVSLGDYLVTAQTKSSKKKRSSKNTSNDDTEPKVELDISNSESFPEIGARKASSLRSDRRRIKPTTIDKSTSKSFSLNSFNSDTFQQPSPLAFEENLAFRPKIQPKESSNNFDVERSILKQERHKLMEKFNTLSTANTSKIMPQIKISQKDTIEKDQVYIPVDVNKVVFKDKIDILVDIYDILVQNNLILSMNTEIYFLISILLSKQSEDEYTIAESKINTNVTNILKSIHNSTYFAVRSLWNQRIVLEVILDKNSLKTLGENKKVRSFSPDLAKFLLNSYGLKCEKEGSRQPTCDNRPSSGIVCFNLETDNVDNFSSALSFHNFKKQRDMFYEILRWYHECQSGARSSFRARIKALLAAGPAACSHAHLAALFSAHMLAECLVFTAQESKLSKLQRRLTCPRAPESHRLPKFTSKEEFYKDFILHADNECFRTHLRDAFASEIVALDATPIATEPASGTVASLEYLEVTKKLTLLAKFLGYLTALPYCPAPDNKSAVASVAPKERNFVPPKEKVLGNNIALRNYSQPSTDLQGLLTASYSNGRLCVTLPWIVHYLSTIDYTALRLTYYRTLIKILFYIYNELKLTENRFRKNTIIFLKSNLSWLFDLPHFPQELFYETNNIELAVSSESIDSCELIDESILFELCPFLKDLTVLLSTSRVCQDQKDMGTFRHITPVSLGVNPEDRIRSKEKELQARLEEEFLKSQPSSTRRVLELVVERVALGVGKLLTADSAAPAAARARRAAAALVRRGGQDKATLLRSLEAMYDQELEALHAEALRVGTEHARARVASALSALLPHAPPPLRAVAVARCRAALARWLRDHATRAILCKDIEEEMKTLLATGDVTPVAKTAPVQLTSPNIDCTSPAHAVIALKELICQLLANEEVTLDSNLVLSQCAACCSPQNIFCRQPTQRAILRLSVDYCVVCVSRTPSQVTDKFLNSLHAIWNVCCPDRRRSTPDEGDSRGGDGDDRAPTPQTDDAVGDRVDIRVPDPPKQEQESPSDLEVFDRILCPRNVVLLSHATHGGPPWDALATALLFLLRHDYLSEDSLTEQCLALYRHHWPQNILENLSACMRTVSSKWSRSSSGKFNLFLDFLAEYCGDMDYEPMD